MRCSGSGSRGGPGHGDAGCGSPPEAARAGMASRRALALLLAFALLTALLVLVEQQQQQHLTLWAVARGAAEEQPHVPAGGAGGEGEGGGTLLNRTQPAQFANATPEDVLVQVFEGEPAVGEDHFFFVETSCALNDKPDPFPYDSDVLNPDVQGQRGPSTNRRTPDRMWHTLLDGSWMTAVTRCFLGLRLHQISRPSKTCGQDGLRLACHRTPVDTTDGL